MFEINMQTFGKQWKWEANCGSWLSWVTKHPKTRNVKEGGYDPQEHRHHRIWALLVWRVSQVQRGFIPNVTTENKVQQEWTSLFVLEGFLCVLFNFNSIDILFALWNPLLQTVMNMNISFDCWWTEGKI